MADFNTGAGTVQDEPGTCFNTTQQENHQNLELCQKDSRTNPDKHWVA